METASYMNFLNLGTSWITNSDISLPLPRSAFEPDMRDLGFWEMDR